MREQLAVVGIMAAVGLAGCGRPAPATLSSLTTQANTSTGPTEDTRQIVEKLGRSGNGTAPDAGNGLLAMLERGRGAGVVTAPDVGEPQCFVDGCYVEVSFKDRASFTAFDLEVVKAFEEPGTPPRGPRGRTRLHSRDGELIATYYLLARRDQQRVEIAQRSASDPAMPGASTVGGAP